MTPAAHYRPAVALAALLLIAPAAADELTATVRDMGFITTCAEQDNVLAALDAPGARRFAIRGRHPAYAAAVEAPSAAADFTDCVFPDEPIWDFEPASHVLYEDATFRLQGHRLSRSWRPEQVGVTVGDRTWPGLHLLQLVVKRAGGDVEVVVLYPADGYWRIKPLPPEGRTDTPFGASLLIGPVEVDRRPLVRLAAVRFDPARLVFGLDFALGGGAEVRVASVSPDEIRLEAALDRPAGEMPTAMLSSMFVAPDNADVGVMRLRGPGGALWRPGPPVGFAPQSAAEAAFVKIAPSRHNTLSPDIVIGPFHADAVAQ